MSEQIVTVKAARRYSTMTYTTALEGRTLQQVAEQAVRDWEEQFEERESNAEWLTATGDGFSITVEVAGQTFNAVMRPVITWVVEATPEQP